MSYEQGSPGSGISSTETQKRPESGAIVVVEDTAWQIVQRCPRHEQTPAEIYVLTLGHRNETSQLLPDRAAYHHICSRQICEWAFEAQLLGSHPHEQGRAYVFVASEQCVPIISANHATNRSYSRVLKCRHKFF